ncbi:MAG: YceI family protein [Flavobacteriales bacterium]
MRILYSIILVVSTLAGAAQERVLFRVQRSVVSFISDAPMEVIKAQNEATAGVLDRNARGFAIRVPTAAFIGFNGPLQMEHFNETYLDSNTWPNTVFQGRIIEAVDLAVPGTYKVRAKGTLTVKGQPRERIIPCDVIVTAEGIRVTSAFDVVLDEHGIHIPGIVQQKIAAVVQVKVDLLFKPAPSN